MKIYLVTAEHQTTPGIIVKACADRSIAVREAITLINVMLKDDGWRPVETESEMECALEALQNNHGAAHCYVTIDEETVICS